MTSFAVSDLKAMSPAVVLFAFGVVAMVYPVLGLKKGEKPSPDSAFAFGLMGALSSLALAVLNHGKGSSAVFNGMVAADSFSWFCQAIIAVGLIGTTIISRNYLKRIDAEVPEYYALSLFSAMGMMLMAAANDLIMLFVSMEVMSISLYVLCAINRGEWKSVESAFKYLLLGSLGSAITVMGIAFLYGASGTTRLDLIGQWIARGHELSHDPIASVGLALLLAGFAFKVAAAPFHMWNPDVYQGSPTPVTAMIATGVKTAAFGSLARVVAVAFADSKDEWVVVLWGLAALTLIVGNTAALVQKDLKRMLAYSWVGHAGYLLMSIVSIPSTGVGDNELMGGLLFYLASYTVMNVGTFAAVTMLTTDGREDARIERLAGLARKSPVEAAAIAVCMLSMAGIPPTLGFVGKFYLFAAAVHAGYPGLAVMGGIGGAIGVYYYLRPIVLMYMHPPAEEGVAELDTSTRWLLRSVALVMLVTGMAVPGKLLDAARDSVLSIFAG
jgi:NADH-quinone oxidoreductase subunit N